MINTFLLLILYLQHTLSILTPDDITSILNTHNIERASWCQPPLIWNTTIANIAQSYANKCTTNGQHSHNGYGENMGGGSGFYPPSRAVFAWIREKSIYNWNCTAGTCCLFNYTTNYKPTIEYKNTPNYQCLILPENTCLYDIGHFTQVVWSTTTQIGCGQTTCWYEPIQSTLTWYVCNYAPAGNYNKHPFNTQFCNQQCTITSKSPYTNTLTTTTNYPTNHPTNYPTNYPTNIPTINPTNHPTNYPSNIPTINPTNHPTNHPTNYPSNIPTINPSNIPTNIPTINPSNIPTINPTNHPTNYPSNIPTNYPTNYPTKYPSNRITSNTNRPITSYYTVTELTRSSSISNTFSYILYLLLIGIN